MNKVENTRSKSLNNRSKSKIPKISFKSKYLKRTIDNLERELQDRKFKIESISLEKAKNDAELKTLT